ncbi:hypothetical protein Tco_1233974 [Tanacetum coccineum]
MAEMFRLLKELTASRTLEKVLVREEARHPITKHVNSISLIRMEEENSVGNNEVVVKNVVEPNKSDIVEPLEKVDRKDEVEDRTNDEPERSVEKGLMGEKVRELVETPRFNDSLLVMQSGKMECEAYHSLPIEPMRKAMLKKLITKKEDMRDIKEDKKRTFILGTPFLTTVKAEIRLYLMRRSSGVLRSFMWTTLG